MAVWFALAGLSSPAEAGTFRCDRRGGEHKLIEADSQEAAIAAARELWGDGVRFGCRPSTDPATQRARDISAMNGAGARPQTRTPLFVTPGFTAATLNLETELTALYLGDFDHARLDRTSVDYSVLLGAYIQTYFQRCAASLPADKVELPQSVCAREQYPVRNGVQVGPSSCIEYRSVPSGVFTTPDLYAARAKADEAMAGNVGAAMSDVFAALRRATDANRAVGDDVGKLLAMNGCTGPGIQRFQDNLARFGLARPPLTPADGATLETARAAPVPGTSVATGIESDYARLLDDLVAENAQSWLLNRYSPNSIRDVQVLGRDARGRPRALYATYSLTSGPNGRPGAGGVKLVFEDGVPACLYFDDKPRDCATAARRIATQYEAGFYRK